MPKPENIILLIADSLRFDSVYQTGVGMPYVQDNAIEFLEARSAGCWTLPATASIFTGLLPHQHGATSQTRSIHPHVPTLAEQLKEAGYATCQVTANIATTDIFGLHRGFDEVRRIWKMVPPKFNRLQQMLALVGKPRLRKKLLSKDLIQQKLSEDLDMAKTWLQYTFNDVFDEARKVIRENESKGKKTFLFLNLMETHFPYHIAPTFELSSDGIYQKLREVISLYHMVNQSFLTKGYQNIKADMLEVLKGRQQAAWLSLAPHVNTFCRELHEEKNNLVIFGADHGENFGETGWTYHFSNITDAGNKVPLFWLPHTHEEKRKEKTPISSRHLYHSILKEAGRAMNGPSLLHNPGASDPVLESFWYNHSGKTLNKYKYNQICFVVNNKRYLNRGNRWFEAPFKTDYDEPDFNILNKNINPLLELNQDLYKNEYLKWLSEFEALSKKVL